MADRAKTAAKKKSAAPRAKTAAGRRKPAARKTTAGKASAKKAGVKKTATRGGRSKGRSAAGQGGKPTRHKNKPGAKTAEQPMMKALRAEHRHIATVMQLYADQLMAIEQGQLVDPHVVYEIMDYMVTWPDRFHHPREDLIYGRVAEIDSKAADEVDTLQRDHDRTAARGREALRDIGRWRAGEIAGTAIVKAGREYIDHMYEHMNVEEKLVFPHIESVLTLEDWRELAQDDHLRALADPIFGPGIQREFRNMTRKLRRNVRRSVERGTMVEWIGIEALMESLDVVTMAYDSARTSASEHLRTAWGDCQELFRESPLTAPFLCAANNTRLALNLLEDVAGISRETLEDLSRVNQERKDRVRLLER